MLVTNWLDDNVKWVLPSAFRLVLLGVLDQIQQIIVYMNGLDSLVWTSSIYSSLSCKDMHLSLSNLFVVFPWMNHLWAWFIPPSRPLFC